MPFEVAAVGDNCIDRFSGTREFSLVGGNAMNVAVQLSRLGRKTAYFGAVGDDDDGRQIRSALEGNGVLADYLRVIDGVTAYTLLDRDESGDRRFVKEEFGVGEKYTVPPAHLSAVLKARHVHIGRLNDRGALRRALVARGGSVSQDISVNADPVNLGVEGLDLVFASHSGSDAEIAEYGRHLLQRGAKMVVITRGAAGSFATNGTEYQFLDGVAISPVDTTGAGDSFVAGFIDAWLTGGQVLASLNKGRETATATCMHLGGFPQKT